MLGVLAKEAVHQAAEREARPQQARRLRVAHEAEEGLAALAEAAPPCRVVDRHALGGLAPGVHRRAHLGVLARALVEPRVVPKARLRKGYGYG